MSFKKLALALLAVTLVFGAVQYFRPVPKIEPVDKNLQGPSTDVTYLPWPTYGQAALGASGYGLLETHGEQKPVPMASVSKVITALAVLKEKPLALGSQGPTITIGPDDVAAYNSYYLHGGSVTKVVAGEQISEYQALQALLLPSSNNMADTLARWAFGSIESYTTFANDYAKQLGAKQTNVADASGISASSTSTAEDLVLIGLSATKDQIVSEISNQQTAQIPEAGIIRNVNWLLGSDGVVGIKTGNTDQAGGCYLFSAQRIVAGEPVQIVGAVLAAPNLNTAISDSRKIIVAADNGFKKIMVIKKGDVLGKYQTEWNTTTDAVAQADLSILAWTNLSVNLASDLSEIAPSKASTFVGTIKATSGEKTVGGEAVLASDLQKPPLTWRLFH